MKNPVDSGDLKDQADLILNIQEDLKVLMILEV